MSKEISRDDLKAMLESGKVLVWATLHDRQDFVVQITRTLKRPIRDVTNEPAHHTRHLIGSR